MKKLILLLLAATGAFAGEGMWMPQQMPELAGELKRIGIQIDPARLSDLTGDPMGAIVSLGGCTASFVSPDGLVVTNHHCVFGSLQQNSTPQHDLMANGFLARTREEELPAAAGTKVWVTTKIEDVTARMTESIKAGIADADRARLLDRREKELVAECEKPGGLRCRVSSFFEGSQYMCLTQAEISDVRLVYAPSEGIGNFGGEIDNFEWPRHVGDFSFYRAYVDGQPYHPKHWLKIASHGVNVGDAVLVAGYPGRTFRYKTADEVRNYRDFVYPTNIRYFTETIRLLEEAGKGSRDVQIRNASRIAGLSNSLKNYTSVNEGFAKDHIVEAREARQAKMPADVLAEIARVNEARVKTRQRDLVLEWLAGRGSPMLGQAMTAVRLAGERTKKDIDRRPRYQERDWPSLMSASTRAQRTIDEGSDRAVTRFFLAEAAALSDGQHLEPVDVAVNAAGGIEPFLDHLYGSTKIGSKDERAKMLGQTSAELKARHDAMLDFAASLAPLFEERETADLATTGAMARLRPAYFEALRKVSGGTLYPDANGTLRITIGRIEGYSPKDATWLTPRTSLHGVVEKETGKEPFASPARLLAAANDPKETGPYIDPELKDVPVNFLSTVDTTGGNSGSPTLNAKGELIGLLFDGNYESIDADFLFNPAMTRSIHVDARYMLWIMDEVDGAQNLLREMGVEPRSE